MSTDDKVQAIAKSWGLSHARRLEDGTVIGIGRLAFTVALYIGLTEESWSKRYCYDETVLCIGAYNDMKTCNDMPEGWIATRG